ncbi:50S ribosomal protein L10 [Chloroflexota bacterium]
MSREKKTQVIDGLEEIFSRCNVGILTDYRGLSTAEITVLRRKLREADVEYRVVKNSLAQFAAKQAGLDELAGSIEGPIAMAFGYGEISDPARVLADYIRTSKSILNIKGGFIGDRVLTSRDVMTLSTLPSREVLISRVMAGIQSPITGLVNTLAGPVRGIMGILQARIKQLEEE